ncbi:O-linked N-acetylglucosamine transferase family protein [Thiocapsa bogorovii]|uniref:O-linked N-acetylglucosamine transferase family protein n=1 Tax=Thiocapsa bogorovii TaxID=521689 RepID=UPI001E42F30B|nr:tetratricopeptide repeat protein [Thiocapsa bogorovii]UHD14524.1 tetratricopeptide repeat protein [Thiocapsa bogorovii]
MKSRVSKSLMAPQPPRDDVRRRFMQAREHYGAGRLDEAERALRKVLKRAPKAPQALALMGQIAARRGSLEEAEQWLRQCTVAAPDHLPARINLGNLLLSRGDPAAAEACYTAAIRLEPRHPVAHYNRGCCLSALGRLQDAMDAYRESIRLKPDFAEPAINLASVLCECERYAEAEAIYRDLIRTHPGRADVRLQLGKVCHLTGRFGEAREHYEAILRASPNNAGARLALASALLVDHRVAEAGELIKQAGSSGGARKTELLIALASLRAAQGDPRSAIKHLTDAIEAGAAAPQHFLTLAGWYGEIRDRAKAVAVLEQSLARFGERPAGLLPALVVNQRYLCDWRGSEERLGRLLEQLRGPSPPPISAFAALFLPGLTASDLQRLTRAEARRFDASAASVLPARSSVAPSPRRLRIGYLSADLHEHATAYLTASVFEAHDRERFEVFAYSYGPDDQSATRRRLIDAFEHFVDIRELGHTQAATRIRDDEIDILVDLKGYTRGARTEILALRPAPIQVNWLGYPGTMAVPFMDYLIADPVVIPPEQASSYDEALAYLPDAYAPVDPHRHIAETPRRAAAGLPDDGFVFCCFNNPRKITPEVFERWCRLLQAVPGSLLWLFASQDAAIDNLKQEAERRGIDPRRLVLAQRVPQPEHLARLALADLMLDTLPYNAHTTASDALWMGVPVLTCVGDTFASRVAASLLHAAGLPELITSSLDAYEAKALRLATDPLALAEVRQRLALARETAPYFDPSGFARHLEALYVRMHERLAAGLVPQMLVPDQGQASGV